MIESTYSPRAGSLAEKAYHALQANGEMNTEDLADAIDTDKNQVQQLLSVPLREGFLVKEKRAGLLYWSVGGRQAAAVDNGTAEDEPKGIAEASHQPTRLRKPPKRAPDAVRVTTPSAQVGLRSPEAQPSPFPRMSTPVIEVDSPFICGEFSDGRVVLELGDSQMTLHPEAVTVLRAFLNVNRQAGAIA